MSYKWFLQLQHGAGTAWKRLQFLCPFPWLRPFLWEADFVPAVRAQKKTPKHAQGADPAHSKPFHPFYTSKTLLHVPPFFVCVSHPAFSAWFCLLEIVLHYERATGEEKKLLLYLALIFPLHSESQKLTFN